MSVYIRELACVLGKGGHRIDIFTRLQNSAWPQQLQLYENVRLIHLRAGNSGSMPTSALHPYLGDFCRQVERYRAFEGIHYDLIHSHYWLSGQVGEWLQNRWKVPHMIMFHTLGALKNMTVQEEQESELRIATEKGLTRSSQRILAATEKEKEHLFRYYGARLDKIGVVPCGVNLRLFHPMNKERARRELGFADDESMVLYVGRLSPIKGADRLLRAMACLKRPNRVRLVIVGGDDGHTPELQNLQHLSQELGMQDAVAFAGRVEHDKLPPYYCAADVVVLPSRYETFGLVALEALASGTPVVATPVGAMESIIRQGETGEVVTNGAPRLLAAGIERFIAKPHNGAVSASAIRATIIDFDWVRVASAIVKEYKTLLEQYHFSCGCGGLG